MTFRLITCLTLFACFAETSVALPLSFGISQGDLSYDELSSDDFHIYHDKRVPHEAAMALEALSAAKSPFEVWFDEKRTRPMPVIMSAVTSGASFANLITDAMELQTLGRGPRDLFWHEYVHMSMYLHLRNFFGPAGIVIHIPWMPAWFIEGLAEALSVSLGSHVTASIERYQALSGDWPTYDRLHSLYTERNFFTRGYASSGAFVTWLLRKGYENSPDFLPQLLRRFYTYTLPHYYPLSMTPVTDFLPFDEALRDFLGRTGRELYQDYKKERQEYWQEQNASPLEPTPEFYKNPETILVSTLTSQGNDAVAFAPDSGEWTELKLHFDKQGWWDQGTETKQRLSIDRLTSLLSLKGSLKLAVQSLKHMKNGTPQHHLVLLREKEGALAIEQTLVKRSGRFTGVWETSTHLVWSEFETEISRLCMIDKTFLGQPVIDQNVKCPASVTLPQSLKVLGTETEETQGALLTTKVWYSIEEQTLTGDRHDLWVWDLNTNESRPVKFLEGGNPEFMFSAGPERWLLVGERSQQVLRRVASDGTCLAVAVLPDLVMNGTGLADGSLVLVLWRGSEEHLRKIDPRLMPQKACAKAWEHSSPLLLAMNAGGIFPLSKALQLNEEKGVERPFNTESTRKAARRRSPASWRPRPVLAFPWVGADDALGYQLGMVTIPLMDHMQNETLFASLLVGVRSRYPNTYVTLVSDRFWPRLSLSAFRRQVWNGRFLLVDSETIESSYIDEKGVRASANLDVHFSDALLAINGGVLVARKDQYIGPPLVIEGTLVEPFLSATLSAGFGKWVWDLNLNGKIASPAMNRDFDYNVVGASTSWTRSLPFFTSQMSLSLEGQRTRGRAEKTPLLKQMYIPLKTFIPGSGGGYNKNSFPVYGKGSLFSVRFGDSQGRGTLNWNFPLIKDVDKLIWIVYLEELRFSSFLNYGGVWNQGNFNPDKHLLLAHGHNVDLLLENKGVRLNFGFGVGQVKAEPFQLFFNAGFNAFF